MSVMYDVLVKLNTLIVMKHGELFSKEGETPSWDDVIKRLDTILLAYKENTIKWRKPHRIQIMNRLYNWAKMQLVITKGPDTNPTSKLWASEIRDIIEERGDSCKIIGTCRVCKTPIYENQIKVSRGPGNDRHYACSSRREDGRPQIAGGRSDKNEQEGL